MSFRRGQRFFLSGVLPYTSAFTGLGAEGRVCAQHLDPQVWRLGDGEDELRSFLKGTQAALGLSWCGRRLENGSSLWDSWGMWTSFPDEAIVTLAKQVRF